MHLVVDELRRHRDLDLLEQLLDELVAGRGALGERLGLLATRSLQARLELGDRVELAGDLREVVVGLGKLALLDGLDGHGDLGLFALVVAAEELRANVVSSPAVSESIASSMPSSSSPEPSS